MLQWKDYNNYEVMILEVLGDPDEFIVEYPLEVIFKFVQYFGIVVKSNLEPT